MKTKVIKIGNSRGIRLPKSIIDQSGLEDEVELVVKDNQIIIKPTSRPRDNWDSAFQKIVKNNDDILLDSDLLSNQTTWNNEEWEW